MQRFRSDGFTHLPPMAVLGELWMKDPMRATDLYTRDAAIDEEMLTALARWEELSEN